MDAKSTPLASFSAYVSSVDSIAIKALRSPKPSGQRMSLADLLDGQAGGKLRETVPIWARRELGAFFSSSDLRSTALSCHPVHPWITPPILDPAMGAGDLLIEAAHYLPVTPSLAETLRLWGGMLFGSDIEPNFVRLAKAHLVLKAIARGSTLIGHEKLQLGAMFPGIRVGNGLDRLDDGCIGGHIIMNPPFTYQPAPEHLLWSSGRTSTAAMFLAKAVDQSQRGTKITAILPDVIRTGSRYERLRSLVGERLKIASIETYGQFDQWTDVDVFVLKGEIKENPIGVSDTGWWKKQLGLHWESESSCR